MQIEWTMGVVGSPDLASLEVAKISLHFALLELELRM